MLDQYCPVCKGTKLTKFRGREFGACAECGALERTRVIYAIFEELSLLRAGREMLHIAPDPALIPRLFHILGSGYHPTDIRPGAFKAYGQEIKATVLDITNIPPDFEDRRFDIILHSHVMEHVRASWQLVVLNLTTFLKPGGVQIFALPIKRQWSQENLSELTEEQRFEKFGQRDHVRYIGRKDFELDMRLMPKLAGLEYFKSAPELLSQSLMDRMVGDPDVYIMKKKRL